MMAPSIDPIAFSIGSFQFRWYGIMYMLAFGTAWLLGRYRASRPNSTWTGQQFDDVLTYGMFGVILGGRLGFVLFYDLPSYLSDPTEILRIWHGGMSFHGGLLGVLLALYVYARQNGRTFWEVMDFVAPLVPPGLFFGRIGNFINGELWGKVTDSAFGVVFPHAGDLPRHPSQLYEAAFEGVVLFIILWIFSAKKRPTGAVAGLFAVGYGLARFGVEFVRMPDAHLGYLAFNWLTMGQVLSLPLILAGLWLMWPKSVSPSPVQEKMLSPSAKNKRKGTKG